MSTATVAVPVIDNLYFDMNGIIHNCTHGNDPKRKPTETEMLLKIFDYLDKLVHLVQPQKLLFLAIDGQSCLCLVAYLACPYRRCNDLNHSFHMLCSVTASHESHSAQHLTVQAVPLGQR